MARTLTAQVITDVTAIQVVPILLVKMEFDNADLNVWTGIGNLTFNGDVYLGTGELGGISPIEESADLRANGVSLSITGILSANLATALGEPFQDRPATIWFGTFSSGTLSADPIQMFKGRMDTMEIEEFGETSIINLGIENELIHLERPNERRLTPQDQKNLFPNDKGFGFVANTQDMQLIWN